MITNAYMRKKEPELVRRRLLDCAAKIAASDGLDAITVQSVAVAAKVTKGGLAHHFPSKRALIEEMFIDQLDKFGSAIDAVMANDPSKHGRFTRAYVRVVLDRRSSASVLWAAIAASMVADKQAMRLWQKWIAERLDRHQDTDSDVHLQVVRYAADGAYYANLSNDPPTVDEGVLLAKLLEMAK